MTQSDLIQEIEEDMQRQKVEKLWKQYGKFVIAAALAIVLATASIVGWRNYRAKVEEKATAGLMEVMDNKELEKADKIKALEDFAAGNRGESPSAMARLQAAALALKEGNKDRAVAIYDELSKDIKVDPLFSRLADLLAVQTLMDSGDPGQLQERLKPLTQENSPWINLAKEYSAHLYMKTGDKEKAKKLFQDLAQDKEVPVAIGKRAEDMLKLIAVESK